VAVRDLCVSSRARGSREEAAGARARFRAEGDGRRRRGRPPPYLCLLCCVIAASSIGARRKARGVKVIVRCRAASPLSTKLLPSKKIGGGASAAPATFRRRNPAGGERRRRKQTCDRQRRRAYERPAIEEITSGVCGYRSLFSSMPGGLPLLLGDGAHQAAAFDNRSRRKTTRGHSSWCCCLATWHRSQAAAGIPVSSWRRATFARAAVLRVFRAYKLRWLGLEIIGAASDQCGGKIIAALGDAARSPSSGGR